MAKSRTDPAIYTRQAAEVISRRLDIPLTSLRWATYYFHTGENWTLRSQWERNVDGHWEVVELEQWQELH